MQRVAVFCGSKNGKNPSFAKASFNLGVLLATHNIQLTYGGGHVGLMGEVANGVLSKDGIVVGVIPEFLKEREVGHLGIQTMHVVPNMHLRKQMMYELCDAAIILPGGYGTLDEFFEIITWNNLEIHTKKVYVLNIDGFYDGIIIHLHKMQEEGFLYENWEERVFVFSQEEDLINHLISQD